MQKATREILGRIDARLVESDRDVLVAAKVEIERLQKLATARNDLLCKIFNAQDVELPPDIAKALQDHVDGRSALTS